MTRIASRTVRTQQETDTLEYLASLLPAIREKAVFTRSPMLCYLLEMAMVEVADELHNRQLSSDL